MKKTLKYISLAVLAVIIICLLMYNPYYKEFETHLYGSKKCIFSGGEYYYVSGDKLFRENEKEPLAEEISKIIPMGDNLLIYNEETVWVYNTSKNEKRLLWENRNFTDYFTECNYIGNEAFVFCQNNEAGYIVRGSTGEVFSGNEGETTEKDGFIYDFYSLYSVTTPQGSKTGIYRSVLKDDISVYAPDIYGLIFIETQEELKAVKVPEDYFFYPENVFAKDEKVYVLAQHIDKDNNYSDRLLVLNTKTYKLEETDTKFEERVVTFKNGTPVIFKDGKFYFEGKEISKMPIKTRGVMTVPCKDKIFVFNGEGGFIYSFDI